MPHVALLGFILQKSTMIAAFVPMTTRVARQLAPCAYTMMQWLPSLHIHTLIHTEVPITVAAAGTPEDPTAAAAADQSTAAAAAAAVETRESQAAAAAAAGVAVESLLTTNATAVTL